MELLRGVRGRAQHVVLRGCCGAYAGLGDEARGPAAKPSDCPAAAQPCDAGPVPSKPSGSQLGF